MSILEVMAGIKGTIGIILGILAAFIFKNSDGGFRLFIFFLVFPIGAAFSIIGVIIFLLIARGKGLQLKKNYVVPILIIVLCMDLVFLGIGYVDNAIEEYNDSYIELFNDKLPSVMNSDFVKENETIQGWLGWLEERNYY